MAATTVTSGPTSAADALVPLAGPPQPVTRPSTPWRPARPARRAAREKKRSGLQRVQRSKRWTSSQPAPSRSARSAAVQRSSLRPSHEARAEPSLERPGDLRADLVAARADRRADRGGELPVAERSAPGLDDPLEETAPAGVQNGERRAGPRSPARRAIGQAVGREARASAGRARRSTARRPGHRGFRAPRDERSPNAAGG